MSTKKAKKFLIIFTIVTAMICTSLIPNMTASAIDDDHLYQYFFMTGQSDCMLISLNDFNVLVDTGTSDSAVNVKDFLDKKGITHLDYLIVTHYDSDHAGGLWNILEQTGTDPISVGTFISRKYSTATLTHMYNKLNASSGNSQYQNYLKLVNRIAMNSGYDIPFVDVSRDYVLANYPAATVVSLIEALKTEMGTDYNWVFPAQGDSATWYSETGLSLVAKYVHKSTTYINTTDTPLSYADNINNDSIVFQLTFTSDGASQKFLYTGDIGTPARDNLTTYDANNSSFSVASKVLKVAHHGFEGSTTTAFANAVDPDIAIVTNDDLSQIADNNYFDCLYETWNAANYVAAADRTHDFVAIRLSSYGSAIAKRLAYMDGTAQTLGVVSIIY